MIENWEHPSSVLNRLGIRPRRRFSQNFLSNRNVAERIASSLANAAPNAKSVFEIGPGTGSLTFFLSSKFQRVFAAEIDRNLCRYLADAFEQSNVTLLCKDALEVSLRELAEDEKTPIAVAGNVPYAISSLLLNGLARQKEHVAAMVLMFQKEFADRMLAPPGVRNCSTLGLVMQLEFDISPVVKVNRGSFYPVPDVDSMVLKFEPLSSLRIQVEVESFERLVHAAFTHRRKKLLNNLYKLGIEKNLAVLALERAAISQDSRAEQLSWDDWQRLYDVLHEMGVL